MGEGVLRAEGGRFKTSLVRPGKTTYIVRLSLRKEEGRKGEMGEGEGGGWEMKEGKERGEAE